MPVSQVECHSVSSVLFLSELRAAGVFAKTGLKNRQHFFSSMTLTLIL